MLKAFVYNYEFVMHALSSPSPLLGTLESFSEIYVFVTHSVNIIKYLGKKGGTTMYKEIINIFIYCRMF